MRIEMLGERKGCRERFVKCTDVRNAEIELHVIVTVYKAYKTSD